MRRRLLTQPWLKPAVALQLAAATIQSLWRGSLQRIHIKNAARMGMNIAAAVGKRNSLSSSSRTTTRGTTIHARYDSWRLDHHKQDYEHKMDHTVMFRDWVVTKLQGWWRSQLIRWRYTYGRFSLYHISASVLQRAWRARIEYLNNMGYSSEHSRRVSYQQQKKHQSHKSHQHHQQHHQHHQQHHPQQHHGHPQNNTTPTILNLQQQLHQAQLHATQIQNTTNSDFKLQLQHTKLQLNRSSQRKQKQLEATINTLRTQLIQGQKIRLQLDNKLADHARQIQTLREQYSTEKEKKLQLQFISETQEKSLWRMAAQIEVGSPYSHLAQDAIQPIIDELKTKLKNTLQDNSDLQHQFNGVTARVEVETQRAAAIQAEYDFQVQENGALKKELDSEKRKVESEKKKVESERRKCEEKLEKLRQIHQEEEMQHRKLLLSLEEDHQTTKDLLVQEKQLSENTIHQLSQVELDLETANKRNEKMEDQLLHATENAKKEYKDIVARLDEAVARNEAREDSFSSHWTASNFRTAVSAGDAAANLLGGHAALH